MCECEKYLTVHEYLLCKSIARREFNRLTHLFLIKPYELLTFPEWGGTPGTLPIARGKKWELRHATQLDQDRTARQEELGFTLRKPGVRR